MIPWEFLDSAKIPGQKKDLCLYRRGHEYSIRIGGSELMNSRVHASEDSLSEISCKKIEHHLRPHILIGGLGMGFTLATALKYTKDDAFITVSEIVPTVVEWNRGVLADLAGNPLDDNRVMIREIDVAQIIKSDHHMYNAILLDVDNGPEGLTRHGNDWLYSMDGLNATYEALKPEGVLAVWSAGPDQAFPRRMRSAGFNVEEMRVRARGPRGRARHTIWLSTKTRNMETWFLYVIRCKDQSLYTGITTDVRRRLKEHQDNDKKGSKYLRGKAPLKTVLQKKVGDKSLASKVEANIKKLSKEKKELLVQGKIRLEEIIDQVS